MQKITPCLWFDTQAEEAVRFYTAVIDHSAIGTVTHYCEGAPMPAGTVMTVSFTLQGQEFLALNGGPIFKFTPAISLIINCETQDEVDRYWEALSEGGEKEQCGWVRDKYGISWQITPALIGEMMQNNEPERMTRVMQALWQMKKIDIGTLEAAYKGK